MNKKQKTPKNKHYNIIMHIHDLKIWRMRKLTLERKIVSVCNF